MKLSSCSIYLHRCRPAEQYINTQSRKVKDSHVQTTVTKWISKLAGGLFVRTLLVCDGDNVLQNNAAVKAAAEADDMTMEALIDITCDPEVVRRAGWAGRDTTIHVNLVGAPTWKDKKYGKVGHASAIVDGIIIRPGDYVTVRYISDFPRMLHPTDPIFCSPGSDDHHVAVAKNKKKNKEQASAAAASIWFARVVYLFEDEEGPAAHMHWLSHGGDTILGETAGPRELFVLDRCDDAPLGSIAGKISVDYIGRDDAEGRTGLGVVELNYHEVNHYFYRLAYSEVDDHFEECPDYTFSSYTDKKHCDCCEKIKLEDESKTTFITSEPRLGGAIESIVHRGISYGLYDFVYLTPKETGEPYIIGQIIEIKVNALHQWLKSSRPGKKAELRISAQVFKRYDTLFEPYLCEVAQGRVHNRRDCRRLYRDSVRPISVSSDRLDGKCVVRHLEAIEDLDKFKDLDDTFYVADELVDVSRDDQNNQQRLADLEPLGKHDLQQSIDNDETLIIQMSRIEAFKAMGRKLRAMDVFGGAGGLTAGLDQSGAIVTEWAIEWDTFAAQTFKRNFPSAKVYNHDANVLLRRAIEEHLGTANGVLDDVCGNKLPCMPKPGEVDFIYGGPPCQDFSVSRQ
jgi:hypothetical protein